MLFSPGPAVETRTRRLLEALPARDTIAWRALIRIVPFAGCFLIVAAMQWPQRDLPFGGDSLGYMIHNTVFMLDNGTPFQPREHDPGHPPLCFLVLGTAWAVFGRSLIVSHAVQWAWMAVMLVGTERLAHAIMFRSRFYSVMTAALIAVHPMFYSSSFQQTPDLAMTAFFVWMLVFFHERRRMAFGVMLALLLLTKANAWPLAFFFCGVEFALIPAMQLLAYWQTPRRMRAIVRSWVAWTNVVLLAMVPLLAWFVVQRWHQGFWILSPIFRGSLETHFNLAALKHVFTDDLYFFGFYRDGNREFVAVLALMAAAVAACFAAGKKSRGLKRVFQSRIPSGGLRPPWLILLSFGLIVFALVFLHAAKVVRIIRYLLPAHALVVIAGVHILAHLVRAFERAGLPYRFRLLPRRAAAVAGILFLANFTVRWDPNFAMRLTLLPAAVREFLRNECSLGYEYNRQIVSILRIDRTALRDIADRCRADGPGTIVMAMYPYNVALMHPEAGYIDEAIASVGYSTAEDFAQKPWHYYYQSPLNYRWGATSYLEIRAMGADGPIRSYSASGATWGYNTDLYRRAAPSAP